VDVFYVTNGNGQKISDEQTLTDIRSSLLKRIEQLEQR
jgi:hypothetical protein